MSDGIENTIGWGQGDTNNTIGWGQAQEAWCESSPAPTPAPVGATLMKTGQTTSYRTGDDGDLEAGRATSFTVLASNNPFGNTNRFTDELGGQTYTNNIVIDWSTYNGSTVLGINRTQRGPDTWENAIDNSLLLTTGGFSNWRLININELFYLARKESNTSPFNYVPLNVFSSSRTFWTSNSYTSLRSFNMSNSNTWTIGQSLNTGLLFYFAVRTFTVTGTTLT
jgi:hypothetical protein